MARLPEHGEENWSGVMNDYLRQTLDPDGNLLTGALNPHTGTPNTNLASTSRAGLVKLTGDLASSAVAPKVVGLQGNPVALQAPKHGQVLAWNEETGAWEPKTLEGPTAEEAHARAMAINSMRI
jgi:hypothetical protein